MSPTEFTDIAISQLGTVLTGRTPPNNDPEYFDGDVDFLTPTDMGEHRRLAQTERSISKFGAHKLSRCLVTQGVAVSCIGWQMGKSILVDRPTITNQQINSIIVNDEIADRLFVYYALTARRKQIFALGAGGSRTPILNKRNFEKLTIKLPSLPMQKRIAEVFGSLDDKIELNRRMNETLEALARTVSRDWFVDFGPILRKAAGETDPVAILGGLLPDATKAAKLAALFSDCLGGNGLPEGWKAKSLGDVVEPRKGRNITKKTVVPGDVPVVAGGLNPAYFHNTPNVVGPVITVSASGANAGFVRLYNQDIWASDCSFISREQSDYLFTIYALLSSRQDKIYLMQQGAAQPHVYPSDLKRLSIADAPEPIWQALEELLTPMFELVASNEQENQTLAATRDLLLPKLMSGEIRLKDAEAVV